MNKPLKILQASAGSGKTFSLTAHYLTLLFSGDNKYREILAVTFTNKATEEMKTRILEVLKGFAQGDEKYAGYQDIILKAHPELNAESLKLKADKIYRKILHDYSRFSVSTIDGFVQKVIRGFAFELGLNADYNLEMNYDKVKDDLVNKLDEALDHNKQLLQWIIDLALERISDNKSWNYKSELYNLINEIFKESFEVFETAVQTLGLENLDELFKNYITITKAEINDFENGLSDFGVKAQEIFNKHGVQNDQLKGKSRNGLLKIAPLVRKDFSKIDAIFKLIDEPEEWFQKGVSLSDFYSELNPILHKIQTFYNDKLGSYALAIAFNKNLYYLRLMQEVAVLLGQYRNENDNLLISDAQKLITGITDDAGENPSFIWEKVGSRYRNFLFDEFQDTSTNQWKSFKSLLTNAMATPSGSHIDNLIVGDTKQSIYRWRNGDWNILHQKAKADVGELNVLEHSLAENYRSTANIIQFNNFLYQSIPVKMQELLNDAVIERPESIANWWYDKGFDHIITSIYAGSKQNLAPSTKPGGTIKVKRIGKGEGDEGRFSETVFREIAINDVIEEIKILKNEKKYQAKDIAILVRSNSEALLCVRKLMEQGIPVLSGDALLISNNSAVQLIINTLKIVVGLDEQTTLYKANCIALYNAIHQKPSSAELYLNLKGKNLWALSEFLPKSLCENWQNWLQLPLAELIENLFDAYELKGLEQHIAYLLAFRDLASNATKMGERGIVSFLNWWDEDGVKKSLPLPDGADAVQIITIHKSKGLAFRAVFVPFCNWEIKTKANSIFWVSSEETIYKELQGIPLKFSDALAESGVAKAYFEEVLYSNMDSLNMLYVATTRSKDYLYLATMDKTKRENISTIGDVISNVIEQLEADFAESNLYEIVEDVSVNDKIEDGKILGLEEYPTTDRLSELYVLPQEKHLKHILNIEKSGRKGSVLHDVLAKASNEKEVDAYLSKLLSEGDIQKMELEDLKQSVLDVLNHPELSQLLNQSSESIIEKNIIDVNGKLHRPDRILMRNNEVVILDYKFTLEQSEKHIEQLDTYKNLLQQMGFMNVKSYLFYAINKELKEV